MLVLGKIDEQECGRLPDVNPIRMVGKKRFVLGDDPSLREIEEENDRCCRYEIYGEKVSPYGVTRDELGRIFNGVTEKEYEEDQRGKSAFAHVGFHLQALGVVPANISKRKEDQGPKEVEIDILIEFSKILTSDHQ